MGAIKNTLIKGLVRCFYLFIKIDYWLLYKINLKDIPSFGTNRIIEFIFSCIPLFKYCLRIVSIGRAKTTKYLYKIM